MLVVHPWCVIGSVHVIDQWEVLEQQYYHLSELADCIMASPQMECISFAELQAVAGQTDSAFSSWMIRLVEILLSSYVVDISEENETRYQLHNKNDLKIPRFHLKVL